MVTEFCYVPVSSFVVLELFTPLLKHIIRIPLAAEGQDGVHAPVKIDTEFSILKPFRSRRVAGEGFHIHGELGG